MISEEQDRREEEDVELVKAFVNNVDVEQDEELKTIIDQRFNELRQQYKHMSDEEFMRHMVENKLSRGNSGMRLKTKLDLLFYILIAVVLYLAIVYHPENDN